MPMKALGSSLDPGGRVEALVYDSRTVCRLEDERRSRSDITRV